MIVEFVGAPCSGKSKISHEIANNWRSLGISVCEKQYDLSHNGSKLKRLSYKILLLLKICITKPRYCIKMFKVIKQPRLFLYFLTVIEEYNNFENTIYEQGLCQLICSLFESKSVNNEELEYYFKNLICDNTSRVLIYIKSSIGTIQKRMVKRNDKTIIYNSCSIENVVENVDKVVRFWISKYGSGKVIIVDNDDENKTVETIKYLIENISKIIEK